MKKRAPSRHLKKATAAAAVVAATDFVNAHEMINFYCTSSSSQHRAAIKRFCLATERERIANYLEQKARAHRRLQVMFKQICVASLFFCSQPQVSLSELLLGEKEEEKKKSRLNWFRQSQAARSLFGQASDLPLDCVLIL
jgi:hypothetical protein